MTTASPCRLHVYLATGAPLGVIMRRGPSDWVRLSLWHTNDDRIEHGQWMAGRVFERRCDLSPDGRLFAYFVRKDSARTADEVGADSWIAVSRPPWFTALALWSIGGTYCTGAYFVDNRSLFIGGTVDSPDRGALPASLATIKAPAFVDRTNDWTDRTVHFNRLLRGGWRAVPDALAPLPGWERTSSDGTCTLVMMERADGDFTSYGGRHVVEYALRDEASGDVQDLGRATWADWDHRGRLMIARDGVLGEWKDGVFAELADFNDHAPEARPSPPEAREWPRR